MTRLRGWAPRGRKLLAKAPHGHWRILTFRSQPPGCNRIDALCVVDGPINGSRFTADVEQCPVPTPKPGGIVILDNLGSHKGQAIHAVGAKLSSCRPTAPTSI